MAYGSFDPLTGRVAATSPPLRGGRGTAGRKLGALPTEWGEVPTPGLTRGRR
jgi:hypothetical protein